MKIALPSDDGVTVAHHFGRSAAFIVFEAQDGAVVGRELRSNGGCGHGHAHGHGQGNCHGHAHEQEGGHHSHTGILNALHDCDVVICSGIGNGAALALQARGVRIAMTNPAPADQVVADFLAGKLVENQDSACRCGH